MLEPKISALSRSLVPNRELALARLPQYIWCTSSSVGEETSKVVASSDLSHGKCQFGGPYSNSMAIVVLWLIILVCAEACQYCQVL